MDVDCIFCKIISKDIDAEIVYEDNDFIAFNDHKPDAEIHIQIIPKQHIKNINVLTKNHLHLLNTMEQLGHTIISN